MSEELCLPVTTQPRVRVYRCGHCREEGHNRATCPGLADQRHQAALRRQDARSENNRQEQEKSKLMDFQIHNNPKMSFCQLFMIMTITYIYMCTCKWH